MTIWMSKNDINNYWVLEIIVEIRSILFMYTQKNQFLILIDK